MQTCLTTLGWLQWDLEGSWDFAIEFSTNLLVFLVSTSEFLETNHARSESFVVACLANPHHCRLLLQDWVSDVSTMSTQIEEFEQCSTVHLSFSVVHEALQLVIQAVESMHDSHF